MELEKLYRIKFLGEQIVSKTVAYDGREWHGNLL